MIGSIGSYTSAAGSTIAPMGPALQAWAASVNASGGIDGHPLDLILKEDGNTPATGLAEAQELVNDHVVALVFDGSFTDYAWSSIFKKAGIPVVGGSSATIQPNNPLYFPSGTTTAALSYGIEYALKLEGVTKVAVPYCAEIAACATAVNTAKPAAEAVGLQVVWGGGVSGSSPDLTPQCIAAKSAGADGVEVALTEQESIHFAEDCAQQGWHPVYGFSTNGINDDLLHIPALATQTISTSGQTTVPWFLNSTPALQAFHAAMAKYAPGTKLTSGAALTAWVGGMLFQAAVQASGSSTVTSQSVINGLYKLHDDTLGGLAPPLTYTPGKQSTVDCFFVAGIKNAQYFAPLGLKPACAPPSVGNKLEE